MRTLSMLVRLSRLVYRKLELGFANVSVHEIVSLTLGSRLAVVLGLRTEDCALYTGKGHHIGSEPCTDIYY